MWDPVKDGTQMHCLTRLQKVQRALEPRSFTLICSDQIDTQDVFHVFVCCFDIIRDIERESKDFPEFLFCM